MNKFYLRLEGVNLDNFVFDTTNLSTIRGSGIALLDAINAVNDQFGELEKKSTGASVGLFLAETDEKPEDICERVRKFLREDSIFKYAAFVVNASPATESFGQDREKIIALNRWQQWQTPTVSIPAFNDNLKQKTVCELDRMRLATKTREIKGASKQISESVFERRKYGVVNKKRFVKSELNKIGKVDLVEHGFARDFNFLTQAENKGLLHHKMAVVYLDGNNFGERQKRCQTVDELKKWDDTIKQFRRQWLASFIENINRQPNGWSVTEPADENENAQKEIVYRFEILMWGGDEICLVVPAWKGWETLAHFFSHEKLNWNGENLTHGAGIVFCHHNAPIRRIKDLAKELAEAAKTKSRARNFFAYEILESFDHIGANSLAAYRKSRSPQPDAKGEVIDDSVLILPGDKMSEIADVFKQAKTFLPRRKLTEIVKGILTPPKDDKEETGKIRAKTEKIIADIGKDSSIDAESKKSFNGERSLWLHLNALWDYVGEEEEENA